MRCLMRAPCTRVKGINFDKLISLIIVLIVIQIINFDKVFFVFCFVLVNKQKQIHITGRVMTGITENLSWTV